MRGYPICVNCLHFIEGKTNYPYDSLPNNSTNGKCKKFGEINVVTGEIDYDFAKYCRKDETKCGKIGTKYTEKPKH